MCIRMGRFRESGGRKMPDEKTRRLAELVIDPSLDPRTEERSQEKIQEYVDNLDLLPPIDIDQNNRILDGIHRFEAHKLAGRETIAVEIFTIESQKEAISHSISSNATHGVQLTPKDIKELCIKLCEEDLSNKEIAKIVIRHPTVVGKYTKSTRERRENELADKVGKLYVIRDDNGKRIYTHEKLADDIGQSTHRVSDLLDRYYANQIKLAVELQDFTDQELLDEFGITNKQLTRIMDKCGDDIYPPKPELEPEDVEKEVVEAVAEPEPATEPEAQERAESESDVDEDEDKDKEAERIHSEMQWMLLWLGNELNLNLWLPKTDFTQSHKKKEIANLAGKLEDLPFDILKVGRPVQRIDVFWLKDNKIIAAFEIENSTGIESGLLRMSHLWVSLEDPSIRTCIVAQDNDVNKARDKVSEPTFKHNKLAESCWFIPYTRLTKIFNEAYQNSSLPCTEQKLLDEIGYKL